MKENNEIQLLIEQLDKNLVILGSIKSQFHSLKEKEIKLLGQSPAVFMLYSEMFVSMYTCCETAFVRISQFFENHLDSEHWHKDLLERMTLEIKDIRPRVLSDETILVLNEYLRFRHFKRYYFEFKYDPKRIAYLESRFDEAVDKVQKELEEFIGKLEIIQKKILGDETARKA